MRLLRFIIIYRRLTRMHVLDGPCEYFEYSATPLALGVAHFCYDYGYYGQCTWVMNRIYFCTHTIHHVYVIIFMGWWVGKNNITIQTEAMNAQIFKTFCINVNDISRSLFAYARLTNVTFMVINMILQRVCNRKIISTLRTGYSTNSSILLLPSWVSRTTDSITLSIY